MGPWDYPRDRLMVLLRRISMASHSSQISPLQPSKSPLLRIFNSANYSNFRSYKFTNESIAFRLNHTWFQFFDFFSKVVTSDRNISALEIVSCDFRFLGKISLSWLFCFNVFCFGLNIWTSLFFFNFCVFYVFFMCFYVLLCYCVLCFYLFLLLSMLFEWMIFLCLRVIPNIRFMDPRSASAIPVSITSPKERRWTDQHQRATDRRPSTKGTSKRLNRATRKHRIFKDKIGVAGCGDYFNG